MRKERWALSWRGWLILLAAITAALCLFLFRIYPFLAVTHRVNSNVLVVEGWVHEYAIQTAVDEFRSGGYTQVFTTGGPIEGSGGYSNDYNTSAGVGADLLVRNGLAKEFVQVVPSRVVDRDRTYAAAVALRQWFREHNISVQSVNVVTENTHARRTRLLFREALGKNVAVGVIAIPNPDYDKGHWWQYSEGVKDVGSEAFAYIYARLFFIPPHGHP